MNRKNALTLQNFFYRIAEPHGAVHVGPNGWQWTPWAKFNQTLRARGMTLPTEVAAGRCIKVDHIEHGRETGLGEDHLGRSILVLDLLSLTGLVRQAVHDGMSERAIERLIPNPCLHSAADDATRAIEALWHGASPRQVFCDRLYEYGRYSDPDRASG